MHVENKKDFETKKTEHQHRAFEGSTYSKCASLHMTTKITMKLQTKYYQQLHMKFLLI